jgi:hypothetical protein
LSVSLDLPIRKGKIMRLLVEPLDPRDTVALGDRTAPRQVGVTLALDPEEVTYTFALEVVDGRPSCRELRVVAHEGGRGIRQADLAALRVEDLVASAYAIASRREDESALDTFTGLPAVAKTISEATGPKYRTMSPQHLERVAQVYAADTTGRPTQHVAESYGIPHPTAARWVQKARAAGHLPRTVKGRKT